MKGSLTAAGRGRRRRGAGGLQWHPAGRCESPAGRRRRGWGGGGVASGQRPRARLPLPGPCPPCPVLGKRPAAQVGTGEKMGGPTVGSGGRRAPPEPPCDSPG